MKRGEPRRKLGILKVLCLYFGKKDGQTVAEFTEEMKALSLDERLKLAQDAAREMELTEARVQFRLG